MFFTDSRSVLNAINNPLIVSKLVKDCIHFLNLLSFGNVVTVMWVPAHSDIVGNETADTFAKVGASSVFIGPEPAVPFSFNKCKRIIKNSALNI